MTFEEIDRMRRERCRILARRRQDRRRRLARRGRRDRLEPDPRQLALPLFSKYWEPAEAP